MPSPREQVTIRLPAELMESIRVRAGHRDVTKTDVIEDALRREFGFGGLPWDDANGSSDLPTRQEFDALAADVKELKGAAERAAAL